MHPAAALHRHENRAAIVEDFQAIPGILSQLRGQSEQTEMQTVEEEHHPEQLALF